MASKSVKIDVHTPAGKKDGSVELPAELFDVEPNIALMHQVVTAQLAAARQGRTPPSRAATSAAVAGNRTGRRAPVAPARVRRGPAVHRWRRRARPEAAGLRRAHPEKMIRAALLGALSDRARNGRIHAVTELVGRRRRPRAPRRSWPRWWIGKQVLIVIGRSDETGALSVRNLPGVHVLSPDQLDTYDVLHADDVVFSVEALDSYISAGSKTDEEVGLMATHTDPRDIILSPVISEKSYPLIEDNVYTFMVHPVRTRPRSRSRSRRSSRSRSRR